MHAKDESADPELGEAVRRGAPSVPADAWSALDAVEAALFGPQNPPRVLAGRYEVRERIGAGGLGVVHRGYDRELARDVAIKLVRGPDREPGSVARQIHEARMLARVQHANIVEVFDIVEDTAGAQVCIVMELVDGVDLRRFVQRARRSAAEIVNAFVAAGTALAAAHAVGVVHCDFKPSNVVVGGDGRARVLDFGLARGNAVLEAPSTDGAASGSTRAEVGGTLVYMAPEQRRGVVGPAADQYAFCISLYECLTGALPSVSEHEDEGVPRLDAQLLAAVPRWLRPTLARGTAPDPAQRFRGMDEMVAALQHGRRRLLRGVMVAVGSLAALVGATVALASGSDSAECRVRTEDAWDEDTRAAIVARLESVVDPTDAQHAAATIDERWAELALAWTRACETNDGLADVRFTCLRRHRARFAGLARRIVDADTGTVFTATNELARDGGVAECETPDASVDSGRNAALFERLATAEALDAEAGLAMAVEVRLQAEAQDDAALVARASLVEGRCATALGELDRALEAFGRAVTAARQSGDDRMATRTAAQLCTATAMTRAADEAVHWCEDARASLARVEDDPELRGNVERAWSAVAFARKDFGPAREHIDAAIAAWRRSDRRDELARDLGNAAKLALSDNRTDDARELVAEAIAIDRELELLAGPLLAGRLHVLCGIEYVAGRHAIALTHCLDAWAILERGALRRHPTTLGVAISTAVVLQDLSRPAESIPFARAAVDAVVETSGPEHEDLVLPLGLLGIALAHGSPAEAEEAAVHVHRSVVLAESSFPSDHPTLATAYDNLGQVLQRRGELEPAIAAFRRSTAILDASFGPTNPDALRMSRHLARALVEHGDCDGARPLLDRAMVAAALADERAQAEALLARCAGAAQ